MISIYRRDAETQRIKFGKQELKLKFSHLLMFERGSAISNLDNPAFVSQNT